MPRALLVGLTPSMYRLLEAPLRERLEVSAVPFPGSAFDDAVATLRPDLVVVDVTYLDEARVRPLMMRLFEPCGSVLAFVSEPGRAWVDHLASRTSQPLEVITPAALLEQLPAPNLHVLPVLS